MSNKLSASSSTAINTTPEKAWQALTDPAMIKEYLFGTTAISDWKKGSSITYKGEWQGKAYEDKGKILDIVPNERLETTYWSSNSGTEDKPENYANVLYEIKPAGDGVEVSITQDNIKDEAGVKHMEDNWGQVLSGMKKLLEK